jgi:hypothetical protein
MTVTTLHDESEEELLAKIKGVVDAIVDAVCEDHYHAPTQEPPMTSRIAQMIETVIKQHPINAGDLKLEVATQDVPDRGSPMERNIGGDLYISLVRRDKSPPVSKGMLVQAKWDSSIKTDRRLRRQVRQMRGRSKDDSYVWSYGPKGVIAIPSGAFLNPGSIYPDMTAGELIAEGLRCRKGDLRIGRDLPSLSQKRTISSTIWARSVSSSSMFL